MDAQSREVDFELDAYSEFLATFPTYKDTMIIDSLRREEYPHLDEKGQVCLDYNGVGLFSGTQIGRVGIEFFHVQSNLATHAMYAQEGSTENYFRKRVLQYLNLGEDDYYIVFTANALSAFKLLGTSYPFHDTPNLLLAYDHKCENVDAISECALAKFACVQSVALSIPWCKIDADDLKKKLHSKRKVCVQKGRGRKGLFAFPYASRVTGGRSSSRWIPQAQQNGWHVLLDITSIDAKIMDSLGLSLYLPEFVICSFYNVFGEDPTGLGCLAVKKSALRTLGDSSRARAIGMVTIRKKQISSLVVSDSSVSVDHKIDDRSVTHSRSPTEASEPGDPKRQPDWSADLMTIDKTLFYQSNGNDNSWSMEMQHALIGKGAFHVNLSERYSSDDGGGVRSKDMFNPDLVIKHKKSASGSHSQVHLGCGSSSFSRWMANQTVPTGSFRSISARQPDERDFNFPIAPQSQAETGPLWRSQVSEIEETETWSSNSANLRKTNGQPPSQSHARSMKGLEGLFYGHDGITCSTRHTSLKRLFKYETKSRLMEHLQKAGQVHSKEVLTVGDWMNYYSEKARLWRSSASSSASSSFQFDLEDPLGMKASLLKTTNTSVQNEIACKGLDIADMLGYKRIAVRLRCLADWLISSLAELHYPPPKCFKLVKFCSKLSLADRASTIAFSLCNSSGDMFDVKRVQLLADRSNISIRTGIVEGTFTMEFPDRHQHHEDHLIGCMELSGYKCLSEDDTTQVLEMPVLYVSLGFLNNFSDVYRLWRFVCRFLDPQFVEHELWHYQALNQETIDI